MSDELRTRAYHDQIDGIITAQVYRRILEADEQQAAEMLAACEPDLETLRRWKA